jgi:hypothetical protein
MDIKLKLLSFSLRQNLRLVNDAFSTEMNEDSVEQNGSGLFYIAQALAKRG